MVQYQKVDSDYPTSIAEHADGLQEQLIWPSGGPAGPPWRRQVRLAWWRRGTLFGLLLFHVCRSDLSITPPPHMQQSLQGLCLRYRSSSTCASSTCTCTCTSSTSASTSASTSSLFTMRTGCDAGCVVPQPRRNSNEVADPRNGGFRQSATVLLRFGISRRQLCPNPRCRERGRGIVGSGRCSRRRRRGSRYERQTTSPATRT